jgi:hypothetical protein
VELAALLGQLVDLVLSGEGDHPEFVRVAGHHVQGVDADGAGGAQDGQVMSHVRSMLDG